jgi:hypothetical protein
LRTDYHGLNVLEVRRSRVGVQACEVKVHNVRASATVNHVAVLEGV